MLSSFGPLSNTMLTAPVTHSIVPMILTSKGRKRNGLLIKRDYTNPLPPVVPSAIDTSVQPSDAASSEHLINNSTPSVRSSSGSTSAQPNDIDVD